MREAMANGRLVPAGPDSPEDAVACPVATAFLDSMIPFEAKLYGAFAASGRK